jgi:S-DNA-T family DNA segregation ATPase FtsK/SpoIIIE
VVVVDEFAVVADQLPDLHSVFVDIAARGRSLGIHLLLCTQRVSGVVRDSVLSNCPLRLCLRVTNGADSVTMVGTSAAAHLPAGDKGLVLIARSGEPATLARVARATPSDVDLVIGGVVVGAEHPHRPWCAPLARHIDLRSLRDDDARPSDIIDVQRVPFAVADLPEQQSQPTLFVDVDVDLPLLVLGAARSGRTTALNTISAAIRRAGSHIEVRTAGPHGPEAWDLVEELLTVARAHEPGSPRAATIIGVIDDLDTALLDLPSEWHLALVDRIDEILRTSRTTGVSLIVSAAALGRGLQPIAQHFENPVILRMSSRLDHAASGEPGSSFDPTAPPGRGRWRGALMQIAVAPSTGSERPPGHGVEAGRTIAAVAESAVTLAVSTRPEALAARLRASLGQAARVILLSAIDPATITEVATATANAPKGEVATTGAIMVGSSVVYVADPDTWQAQWAVLTRLRHSSAMLFDGCTLADFRAITRSRDLPPPFSNALRAVWLQEPAGATIRLRLD